jgi:hypothetical protein
MVCVKGFRVNSYFIQSKHKIYPITTKGCINNLDEYKMAFILLEKHKDDTYTVLKFVYCD